MLYIILQHVTKYFVFGGLEFSQLKETIEFVPYND